MLGPVVMVMAVLAAPGEAARLGDEVQSEPAPTPPPLTSSVSAQLNRQVFPVNAGCNFTAERKTDRCEQTYRYSRLAAMLIPAYVISTDGIEAIHGMLWTLAFDVPTDDWRETFSLGDDRSSTIPVKSQAFRLAFAGQLAWYPGAGLIEGRVTLRTRVLSIPSSTEASSSYGHLSVVGGIFGNRVGLGPRIELRARIGHLAWGGVVLAVGFQPNLFKNYFATDVSLGLDAPWMWWW